MPGPQTVDLGDIGTTPPQPQTTPDEGSSLPAGFVPYTASPNPTTTTAPVQGSTGSANGLPPGFVPYTPPAEPAHQGFSDVKDGEGKIDTDDNSNLLTQGAKQVAAVGAGVGKGLLDTLSGASGLVGADGLKKRFDEGRQELDKDNAGNSGLNSMGYGGETLAEFMMGDEALKGLSFAKRLMAVSKVADVLEKSPRLLQALKIGANAGLVQGTQTGLRTDGSFMDRAKAGAESGAIGAGTGAVIGGAGNLLGDAVSGIGKGIGDASKTVEGMWTANNGARSAEDLASDLGDDLRKQKAVTDSNFNNAKTTADADLGAQTDAAKTARESELSDQLINHAENQDTVKSTVADQKSDAGDKYESSKDANDAALDKSKSQIQGTFVNTLAQKAGNASDPSELAKIVNDGINEAEKESHTNFEEGLNGKGGVIEKLGDKKQAVVGSPLQAAAKAVLKEPTPGDHELTKDAAKMAGNNIRGDVKTYIENIAKGSKTAEVDPNAPKVKLAKGAPKPIPEEIPLKDMSGKDLIAIRQHLRSLSSEFMRGDVNRRVIADMIDGVDDTLGELAGGKSDAIDAYSKLRGDYKASRTNLDSRTADKLNLNGEPDKAVGDVNKYLLGGDNAEGKITTLRNVIGDGTMQQLAKTYMKQLSETASKDPQAAIDTLSKIPAKVRRAFFGPQLDGELGNASKLYQQSLQHAQDMADNQAQGLAAANTSDKAAIKASGDFQARQNTIAHRQALLDIRNRSQAAVKVATDAHKAAMAGANASYDVANSPFTNGFVKSLSSGDVNANLMTGKASVSDIKAVKSIVGDAKWKDISRDVFNRQMADAKGNPKTMLDWWNNIDPLTRKAMFSLDDPMVGAQYRDTMSQIEQATKYRFIVRGILGAGAASAGALAGASIGSAAGHVVGGPVSELIGAVSGLGVGSKVPFVKSLLDHISDNPSTWKKLGIAASAMKARIPDVARSAIIGKSSETANKVLSVGGTDNHDTPAGPVQWKPSVPSKTSGVRWKPGASSLSR